jgi:SAM-dependent methyltransferase
VKLNIGPGISGTGDKKIDLYPFEGVTHVVDVAVEDLPFESNFFDEVEASQVLEHIPAQIRWPETKHIMKGQDISGDLVIDVEVEWHLRFARVELMREIHRVLKTGGVLIASVPGVDVERGVMRWAQDPTHVDVPWILESFDYFCNAWGGGNCKHEAHFSSGINFGFQRIRHEYSEDRSVLTVWLQK